MHSKLILSTKLSEHGKSQLNDCFVSPPFKLMTLPVYDDPWQHGLNAMQMSSSPGLLGGDYLDIQISLAEDTALSLHTQAFARVQAMNAPHFAEQITKIQLAKNSCLFYLPHPLVLHKDSALKQKTQIEMGENAKLIYGEVVAIGRVLNDERFAFRHFSSHLKIATENKLLVSDCIQWHPATMNLTALSQMEDYSHQGSLLYLNLANTTTELKQHVLDIRDMIGEPTNMLIGISQLNEGGFMLRVLAHRAETIQQLFETIGLKLKQN
ncbi:urease accessory protein UreD [Pasteurella sp. PK-2025]|uniref:urease accessory protein UreD n=1 Tax=Pasteurella sp. PK-2025 TaxID=3413133 RepID=UPI003C72E054